MIDWHKHTYTQVAENKNEKIQGISLRSVLIFHTTPPLSTLNSKIYHFTLHNDRCQNLNKILLFFTFVISCTDNKRKKGRNNWIGFEQNKKYNWLYLIILSFGVGRSLDIFSHARILFLCFDVNFNSSSFSPRF